MIIKATKIIDCKSYDIVDPFSLEDFPIIVFAHREDSVVGSAINCKTKGVYNHVMWQIDRYTMASQEFKGFVRVPVDRFLLPTYRLKFLSIDNKYYRSVLLKKILEELAKPWYARRYDFLGILGQAIGLPWIQSPLGKFCSEQMALLLNEVCHTRLPKRPSPSTLNTEFKFIEFIKLLGYWWND